jgi:antitoxin component YwqK of YwqJK toxin-antitoxin module
MEKRKGQLDPRPSGGRSTVSLKCVTGLWMLFLVGCEPPALLDISSGAVWVASVLDEQDTPGAQSARRSVLDDERLREKILAEALAFGDLRRLPQEGKIWPEVYLRKKVPYTGWVKSTFANGQAEFLGYYSGGKTNGLAVIWAPDDQILEQVHCEDGIQRGLATLWHENGTKKAEGYYKDDKRCGVWVKWHPSGQKWREFHYKEGEMDGRATSWHDNGQKHLEGQFKAGKMWGPWKSYYRNGHKSTEGAWRNDERDGLWIFYDKYGEVKRLKTYKLEKASDYFARRRV